MIRVVGNFVAPVYLLLCLVLGGSVQDIWGVFALQIFGIGILVWTALRRKGLDGLARLPLVLAVAALLIVCLQLIPLPSSLWGRLPGRSGIVAGYEMLHVPIPWLSISETPFESVDTLFALIPPLAILATITSAENYRRMAIVLLAATAIAIGIGALQVASGSASAWYFYTVTNTGAVGFFANSNHMGTLLLTAIPFVAALLLSGKSQRRLRGKKAATILIAVAALGLILVGIVLNRSLAALLLSIPVLLATGLMVPAGWRFRWIGAPVAALSLAGAVAAVGLNPLNSTAVSQAKQVSFQSRQAIWRTTGNAIAETFPFGTGLGSFAQVYRHYEDPESVDSTYVNHAHNDYLELTLELGLVGIALIVLFLAWWFRQVVQIWSSNLSSPFERAATIASAAILAHSLVDYPLRTAALASVFAVFIGILARFNLNEGAYVRGRSTGMRHVTIG